MSTSTKRRQTRSQRADKRSIKPFVGVDGEGGKINGVHEYLLLRAGDYVVETGEPLTSYECLGFLSDLPKNAIYVSFAFDYDVTMMIRHLPPERIELLFNRSLRAIRDEDGRETGRFYPVSVGHGEFQIDYMPHKEFRVRRKGGKWTVISDTFTFFQSSFVRALEKWYADEPNMLPLIARIAEGKEQRNSFGQVTEDEREYNKLEVIILASMMERFRFMCAELNIFPRKWQGPGNLVTAVFKRVGLPTKFDIDVPYDVMMSANAAYCGGRFEVSTFGHIEGPVYQYDLNSAYASYYKHLPCLNHGTWKWVDHVSHADLVEDADSIFVGDVRFKHPDGMVWNTLPVRSAVGTLLFPQEGRGWYWCHELRIANKYGARLEWFGGWRYTKECECSHFDWVYELYAERDRVGKDSGKGKVLKIVLATIYGKLAQSKGSPIFANPIWSGLVVSSCRARLVDAALQRPGGTDVYMLATDGLFCGHPRDLVVGKKLGDWTVKEHESLFVVQSGIYFVPGEKPKTRGVPQSKVIQHENDFRRIWREWCANPLGVFATIPLFRVPLRVFISARLARARRKPHMAGMWIDQGPKDDGTDDGKAVRFEWTTKRQDPVLVGETLTTMPIAGGPWLVSKRPDWVIGGEWEGAVSVDADQPDWGDHMLWDEDM